MDNYWSFLKNCSFFIITDQEKKVAFNYFIKVVLLILVRTVFLHNLHTTLFWFVSDKKLSNEKLTCWQAVHVDVSMHLMHICETFEHLIKQFSYYHCRCVYLHIFIAWAINLLQYESFSTNTHMNTNMFTTEVKQRIVPLLLSRWKSICNNSISSLPDSRITCVCVWQPYLSFIHSTTSSFPWVNSRLIIRRQTELKAVWLLLSLLK